MSKYLTISLVIVALVLGVGIGFYLSPEFSSHSANTHTGDLGKADKQYDLRFVDAMIAHHMGAIEMAKTAQEKSQRDEVKNLARNIITAQEKEIEQLYTWKKNWYNDSRKISMNDYSMYIKLGDYDDKFDLRFINAIVAHHEGAIDMAKDAQRKSTRNEILNTASNIINDQSKEIQMMKEWRTDWYQIKDEMTK